MKLDCNVIRDLMPLVLDEAASAESKALVDEHLTGCPDCQTYYSGMKAAVPASPMPEKTIITTAKKLRKTHRMRILRNVLIGLVVGVLLMLGFSYGMDFLRNTPARVAANEDYHYTLSQLKDGRVAVSIHQDLSANLIKHVESRISSKEGISLYLSISIPYLSTHGVTNFADSFWFITPEELSGYSAIYQGTPDNRIVIWQPGDEIPAASEEMEAYFALEDAINALPLIDIGDGKAAYSREDTLRLVELQYQRDDAYALVPEWH